jgi:hypothetical protein
MVLLGVRVNELPEPARSDGHAEKTEFMAEGAEAADHSCERESHMGGQSATANTLKELYLVGYDHRICQKRFRNRLGRTLGVLPRHVPHCSAGLARTQTSSLSCPAHLSTTRPYKYHLEHAIFSCHPLPCSPLTMSSFSRSSSLTSTSTSASASPAYSSTTTILQDEQLAIKLGMERDEARFEFDGGNDPQDPPAKNNSSASPLPFLPKPNTDPNVVTWDGPEDPENPKNWSFWYRWWITILCTVMTLNVYVPPERDLLSSCTD